MPRRFIILMLALLIAGCATSPTGRHQLKLFSKQKMAQIGDASYAQLKRKTPIDHNATDNRFVECVVNALGDVAHGQWNVTVFKSKEINAFALPGGNIGVYSGILPVTKNGAQLAAVLGHEMGHVLAGHADERVSEQYATQGGLSVLAAFLGGGSGGFGNRQLMGLLGLGAQVGILLPFSRAQESEADLIGLEMMARAGFDPRQSVALWRNMTAASHGKQPPELLSTHPSNENRIQRLQSHMGKAMQLYEQAPRHPHCSR
jgi:predicted Zn-dependent protease